MIDFIMLVICLISIGYYGVSIYSAYSFFSHPIDVDPDFHPPITLLKPVCGLEKTFYENFSSFCQQDYPEYEIIFGVPDTNDPIIHVINEVIKSHPNTNIQLVICDEVIGANPKVNNLIQMQKKARFEFLLISDSDICVGPHYLQQMIQPMKNTKVGVVTSLYRSVAKTWSEILEATRNAAEGVPGALFANLFLMNKVKFIGGWSILIRESLLNEIGGIQTTKDSLGEDFLLGRLVTDRKYNIVISNYIIENIPQSEPINKMFQRRTRWAKGILVHAPLSYISILFTYGTVSSLFFLLICHNLKLGWVIFLTSWVTRLIMSWIIGVSFLNDPATKKFFWISPLQDFAGFLVWFNAFFAKKIYWGEKYFTMGSMSKKLMVQDHIRQHPTACPQNPEI